MPHAAKILPFDPSAVIEAGKAIELHRPGWGNPDVIPQDDVILKHVAPDLDPEYYNDERSYDQLVRSNWDVSDSLTALKQSIKSQGFEVRAGSSKSPRAEELREFGFWLWQHMGERRTTAEELVGAWENGWQPMQTVIDPETTYQGRATWSIRKVNAWDAWRVRHRVDGGLQLKDRERELIVPPALARIGWMTPRCGTTKSVYGRGQHHHGFILGWIGIQVRTQFGHGFERQMGAMVLRSKAGAAQLDDAAVEAEIAELLQYLNAYNLFKEGENFSIDVLTDLNFTTGALDAMRFLSDATKTFYTGQTLTSNIRDQGSRAAAEVHKEVKLEYAQTIAMDSIDAPMTDLIHRMIFLNFGEQLPEDLPSFFSRVRHHKADLDAVARIRDMGGLIDLDELARNQGVDAVVMPSGIADPPQAQQSPIFAAKTAALAEWQRRRS